MIERQVAGAVGAASSLLTILMVVFGKHCGKAVHRFFLYYSIAAVLLSAFELTKEYTCTLNSTPEVYQANVCVVCYFSGAQLLLLCWISAYLLMVGVFQWVRLRGWKSEVVAMAVVLLFPAACAWKPIYMAVTPAQQTYGCNPPIPVAHVALAFAFFELLLCVVSAVTALATFANLVWGTWNRAGPYHSTYVKAFRSLLPLFAFLLVANIFGFWHFALSLFVALKKKCPVPVEMMQDLVPLTFVSIPICYVALVYKVRCIRKESVYVSDVCASIGTVAEET